MVTRIRLLARTVALVALAAGSLVTTSWSATPAVAAAAPCTPTVVKMPPDFKPTVVCIRTDDPPDNPGDQGNPDPDGTANPDPNNCRWELFPIPDGVVPDRPGGVSPGATMYWEQCTNEFGNDYVGPGGTQWFEPGATPLPSPEEVATTYRVEISSRLHKPTLHADPPRDDPSLLDVPTFVAVTNWLGEQTAGGCESTGTVCVDVVATPTLTFDPGEAGSDPVTCEGGGTRYVPGGPPPREQALAPGACAHAYERRTGVDDRPGAWPGVGTVSWAVHWSERGTGVEGDFPELSLFDTLPREVEEVQGVVSDGA